MRSSAWTRPPVCGFSRIVLLAVALAIACLSIGSVDFGGYSKRLDQAKTEHERTQILSELAKELPEDSPILEAVSDAVDANDSNKYLTDHAAGLVRAKALLEAGPQKLEPGDPKALAKEITSSPSYSDPGVQESSNWMKRAIERLLDKLRFRPREPRMLDLPSPGAGIEFFVAAMWVILGAALGVFLYFAIRSFAWKRSLRRKASALLGEDEPERTADEWLEAADKLIREGKLREAVRSLYLACLLRLDEHGVARFDRGQTNWEHLARIQASPKLPSKLDFRPPTNEFDRIWYGMRLRGQEDVDAFRRHYLELMGALQGTRP